MVMKRFTVRSGRNQADRSVIFRICSVHIACKPAAQEGMEKSRIEFDPVLFQPAFYPYAAESFFP